LRCFIVDIRRSLFSSLFRVLSLSAHMPFDSLGLAPALVHAAAEAGYAAPTAIQAAAIPAILQGRDVRGSAQTGSGKTAAYALPLLQRLAAGRQHAPRRVRVLVLVPTRELAAQVGEVFRRPRLRRYRPARPRSRCCTAACRSTRR
jgi:superfamily II DNA/RNA helicase